MILKYFIGSIKLGTLKVSRFKLQYTDLMYSDQDYFFFNFCISSTDYMNTSIITKDTKQKPELVFHHIPVKIFVQY